MHGLSGQDIQLCRGVDLLHQQGRQLCCWMGSSSLLRTPLQRPPMSRYKDLFIRFILLGWIAFGGPFRPYSPLSEGKRFRCHMSLLRAAHLTAVDTSHLW